MSSTYNSKSCSALEKPYYSPLEAALRWCNLIAHERTIVAAMGSAHVPAVGQFPQWPCLRVNVEKIFDAIVQDELPHGRDGRTVDEHVAPARLTVRHKDLKDWMAKSYPDQKPTFLFDDVERTTHSAINADSFRALQADRDAMRSRFDKAEANRQNLERENEALRWELAALRKHVESLQKLEQPPEPQLPTRTRRTLLTIVAALCDYADIDLKGVGTAVQIAGLTQDLGAPVSDDTVRGVLKEIPDALESRQK